MATLAAGYDVQSIARPVELRLAREIRGVRDERVAFHAMIVSAGRWETSRRCKAASVRLHLSRDR